MHEFCAAAAAACAAHGAAELVPRITALSATGAHHAAFSDDPEPAAKLLQNLARPFIHAFFPTHAAVTLVFNTVLVLVGPEELHAPCLLILKSLFQSSNLELGSFGRSAAHVSCLKTLVLLLEGGRSAEVLQGLDVVLEHLERSVEQQARGGGVGASKDGDHGSSDGRRTPRDLKELSAQHARRASEAAADDEPQQVLADFLPVAEASVAYGAMAAALQQCVHAAVRPSGRASGGWTQRSRFLPFVQ